MLNLIIEPHRLLPSSTLDTLDEAFAKMASLDRMAIRGVRSFDDKKINVIQFFSPLTVIVGTNGSGKTTIIECLKYCTTGDLPPNSKGGAFVHDPSMSAANEIKAQIRLRFYNTNRVRINCARNLQVTRKKGGGLTMKTLETILQIDDPNKSDNRRTVLSTKCAEIDEEMPAALGVSRAILDNVIFCHQEDNNWPLGEAGSLKKRFDDIFEATRYTKALDNIKTLRKERAISLKVGKAELDGLKTDRQRADAVRDKLHKLEDDLKQKEGRLDQLNAEVEELTVSNKEMSDKAMRFRETVQKAEGLEDKKQLHEENLTALRSSMTELQEDESELQRRKDGFETHLQDLKRKQDDLKRRVSTKKNANLATEKLHSEKLSQRGALESDRKHHERALRQQTELIRQAGLELGIAGYDDNSFSRERVEQFSEFIDDDLRRLRREFDLLKAEFARTEEDASRRLQDLQSEMHVKQAARNSLMEETKRLKDRIKTMQSEIDSVPATDVNVDAAKREQAAQESRLRELTQDQSDYQHDNKIRDKNAEIRKIDDRREELTAELNLLNRQADFRAKLDMSKKSAMQRRDAIETLLSRHSESFTRLVGQVPPRDTVEADVDVAKEKSEKELALVEEREAEATKQFQQLEATVSFAQKQMEDKRRQEGEISEEIQKALGGEYDTLEEAIKQCNEEIEYARSQLALYESMSSFIRNMEGHMKEKKACLGCNRSISQAEMPSIEAHVIDMMQKAQPAKLQGYKEDLSSWEEQLETFLDLKPKVARLEALRDEEIPAEKKRVTEAQSKMKKAKGEVENAVAQLEKHKGALREINALGNVATEVARLISEQKQFERDSISIENDLRSTGSTRTGDQVQEEIDGLTDSIKRFKRDVQTLQQEKDTLRATIASQERAVHKAEMAVAQTLQDQDKLLAQQKRLEELKSEQEESARKYKAMDAEMVALSDPIQTLSEGVNKIKSDNAAKKGQAQTKISDISIHSRKIQEATDAAQSFLNQRGPEKLRECEEAIESFQEQMQRVREEIDELQHEVDRIEKDLNESRATERNISDNLRFIRLQREVRTIDDELRGTNLEDALRAHREWNEKYTAAKRAENDLNGKAAHLNGELSGLRAQIDARKKELRDDYKDVHSKFTEKLVEVKTSELAQNDLELYVKALKSAIMRFHSIKMEEINETLNNLWVKTYKGTDIDTIKICADGEGAGARTYNYRVVMVKDNAEMDMRGRCSAGQKCLASILIRLSLADSFSENCGIMALDEPTTNLDEHNILALAESLGTLIEERRKQSNFQLIVITHDVNFLSQLSQSSGGIEHYFRLERDHNYRSTIVQESQLP